MAGKRGILNLDLSDKHALYLAYMSFLEGGGLFVPTNDEYQLGDEVFMLVTLPEQEERKGIAGRVAWITPRGATSPRVPGIGVQISAQNNGELQRQIETILAGIVNAERPTRTL